MKRFLALLLTLCFCLSLVSCGKEDTATTSNGAPLSFGNYEGPFDITAEVEGIIQKYNLKGGIRYTSSTADNASELSDKQRYLYYGDMESVSNFDKIAEYDIYITDTDPENLFEFGIFELGDGADTHGFIGFLKTRLDNVQIAYDGVELEGYKNGRIGQGNGFVWYCAIKGANEEINSVFNGRLGEK